MYDGVGMCATFPRCTLQPCVRLTDFVHMGSLCVIMCVRVYIYVHTVYLHIHGQDL